jgi:hypothetical protein
MWDEILGQQWRFGYSDRVFFMFAVNLSVSHYF